MQKCYKNSIILTGDNVEKIAFVDERIRDFEIKKLEKFGLKVILIPRNDHLYNEISSHTDILLCKIGKYVVVEKSIYKYIYDSVNKIDKNLTKYLLKGNSYLDSVYPLDIAYNVFCIGNICLHNFKYTDDKVKEIITKNGLKKINVEQGYTNCSVAKINEHSAITSDKKIASVLKKEKIDVLLIENEKNIKLYKNGKNFSNMSGFIGGVIENVNGNIIITGDSSNFLQREKIIEFIKSKNLEIIDFKKMELIDYGGIICM